MRSRIKRSILSLCLSASVAMLAPGCGEENGGPTAPKAPVDHPVEEATTAPAPEPLPQTQPAPPAPPPTLGDIKDQAAQTLGTTKEYLSHQKDQLVEQTHEKIEHLSAKIDNLRDHVKTKSEDAKAKWPQIKADLDAKLKAAREKAKQYKDASAETADKVGQGLSDAVSKLESAVQRAKSHFTEDDAPATQPAEPAEPQK